MIFGTIEGDFSKEKEKSDSFGKIAVEWL